MQSRGSLSLPPTPLQRLPARPRFPVVAGLFLDRGPGVGQYCANPSPPGAAVADHFDTFIRRILSHEGGYSSDRTDPGNYTGGKVGVGQLKGTKYGIAANTYPNLDIKALTWEQAVDIYRRDFWDASKAGSLPAPVGFQLLDGAVNSGISRATRWLQRAAGVADDGIIGPNTRKAITAADPADLVMRFLAERLEFMTGLSNWPQHGKGWARRIAQNLRYGASDT